MKKYSCIIMPSQLIYTRTNFYTYSVVLLQPKFLCHHYQSLPLDNFQRHYNHIPLTATIFLRTILKLSSTFWSWSQIFIACFHNESLNAFLYFHCKCPVHLILPNLTFSIIVCEDKKHLISHVISSFPGQLSPNFYNN